MYIMPPKEKKTKKPKKPVTTKRRKRRTITQITQLPQFTGANRDIPMGGSGGSSNLLASIAANRPPSLPPMMPIQTPDAFKVAQEQARQAQVLEQVVIEQEIKKQKKRTDAEIAEHLGISVEQYKADRRNRKIAQATAVVQSSLLQKAGTITEPLPEQKITEHEVATPSSSVKKAARGQKAKQPVDEEISILPEPTVAPVIGLGNTYPGGAPVKQQGLNMAASGRLKGSIPDNLELGEDTDVTVFMG